jgi:hypothetical protein
VRIGNGEDITWNNTGKSIAGRKQTAREGGGQSVPGDTALAALDAYEAHQRVSFEALYWNEPAPVLAQRDALLAEREADESTDGVRRRRIRAERWAIGRIARRRMEEEK